MSNYSKNTNFASKDSLATGNPLKIIKGTEIDDEFNAIETSVATKADTASPAFTGTPTAPTAASGTNNTQIATTAFVTANFPSTASPTFTGTVTIPTLTCTTGTIGTLTSTTANITTIDLGNWTITENSGNLLFAYGGVEKFKMDSTGHLTVTNDVTAFGTI
jgi:hypothetical protein